MAFGKPVLCSKYAGSRQMVEHGENGFIFDPYDTKELAGYMAKFIHDRDLVAQFGARSKEKIAPFTPTRAADVLADLTFRTAGQGRDSHSTTNRKSAPTAHGAGPSPPPNTSSS